MCKALTPASFLALTFKSSRKRRLSYQQLERCRVRVTHVCTPDNEPYDVDWSHDSYLYTMGFYSPIFKEDRAGIACDFAQLDKFYELIISDLGKREIASLQSALQDGCETRAKVQKRT